MTDYEQLVKALLSASTVSTAWEKLMRDAAAAIEALQAQLPKRGEWIKDEEKSQKHVEAIYICSACHNFNAWGATELYTYCPLCGAKMTEVKDG